MQIFEQKQEKYHIRNELKRYGSYNNKEYVFIANIGNIGDVADFKINGVLEYFRYEGTLQNATIIVILLISTTIFSK